MMTFRIILLSSISIFFSSFLHSQDNESLKQTRVKLYYNSSYQATKNTAFNTFIDSYATTETTNYTFGGLSIAIEFDKGKFLSHEVEFLPILINIDEDVTMALDSDFNTLGTLLGTKTTSIKSAIRYQITHAFIKDKAVLPYLGVSSQLYGMYNKDESFVSSDFSLSDMKIGCLISIVPGIIVNLNNKLAVDINIPISFYDFGYNWTRNENPTLPLANQKSSEFVGDFFPTIFNVRLGLIYKI